MAQPRGPHAPHAPIVFSSTHRIEADALDRAIRGGIAHGSLGAATAEHHEEVGGETRLAITEHAAAGKRLTGDLSSLAFRIAYNKTRDIFRRTRADALARRRAGDAAERAFLAETCPDETAEARLARLGETALRAALLRGGLSRLSPADRAALSVMLARPQPLPRGTQTERQVANRVAQAEKRARDRLTRAVRETAR